MIQKLMCAIFLMIPWSSLGGEGEKPYFPDLPDFKVARYQSVCELALSGLELPARLSGADQQSVFIAVDLGHHESHESAHSYRTQAAAPRKVAINAVSSGRMQALDDLVRLNYSEGRALRYAIDYAKSRDWSRLGLVGRTFQPLEAAYLLHSIHQKRGVRWWPDLRGKAHAKYEWWCGLPINRSPDLLAGLIFEMAKRFDRPPTSVENEVLEGVLKSIVKEYDRSGLAVRKFLLFEYRSILNRRFPDAGFHVPAAPDVTLPIWEGM